MLIKLDYGDKSIKIRANSFIRCSSISRSISVTWDLFNLFRIVARDVDSFAYSIVMYVYLLILRPIITQSEDISTKSISSSSSINQKELLSVAML